MGLRGLCCHLTRAYCASFVEAARRQCTLCTTHAVTSQATDVVSTYRTASQKMLLRTRKCGHLSLQHKDFNQVRRFKNALFLQKLSVLQFGDIFGVRIRTVDGRSGHPLAESPPNKNNHHFSLGSRSLVPPVLLSHFQDRNVSGRR